MHITNVKYQNYNEGLFYFITYPGVRAFSYAINVYGNVLTLVNGRISYMKYDEDKQHYLSLRLVTPQYVKQPNIKVSLARLVAWEFVGHPENYNELEVNHADGDHYHNYYKNLEWVTPEENNMHRKIYGLAASRENHGYSNHKEVVVKDIINLMEKSLSAPEIARFILKKYPDLYSSETKYDYDRIRGLVSKIKNRTSWYTLVDELEGSTTIENIIYEKHVGEEVSRVGRLHPLVAIRNGRRVVFVGRIHHEDIV